MSLQQENVTPKEWQEAKMQIGSGIRCYLQVTSSGCLILCKDSRAP